MSREIGQKGEDVAAEYLVTAGYKIVAKNFLTRFGEIDIIAKEKKTLVFVEVKQRKNDLYGTPAEFINKSKLDKIIKTAKHYLYENDLLDVDWRIDAVVINQEKDEIQLLKNIFTEGLY